MRNDYELIKEREFQDRIYTNKYIQKGILDILQFEFDNCTFEREIEFINGIRSDFVIYDDKNEMKAIIECKRPDIGVTEYVRGVGQLFQYEYFQEENIPPRKYYNIKYNNDINNNILVIPSDFIKNTALNIGKFKYPKNSRIFEVNSKNDRVREISKKELLDLSKASDDNNLITISQYYVRDNRLFECYILFQILCTLNPFDIKMNRTEKEIQILRQIEVINSNNWRNAFITLSSLGFIGKNDKVYGNALNLLNYNVYEFINLLYSEYLYPFIDVLMNILIKHANSDNVVDLTNKKIAELIRKDYNNKDVLFLTDSDSRYISSWLNIMRDDLGCINFEPRSSKRKIVYQPSEIKDKERINKIKEFSNASAYIDNFNNIKNNIFKGVL